MAFASSSFNSFVVAIVIIVMEVASSSFNSFVVVIDNYSYGICKQFVQ